MLADDPDKSSKIDAIIKAFGDHALTLSHARHLDIRQVQNAGVKVVALEDDQELQEAVLTVHHASIQTLSDTGCIKIIENQNSVSHIRGIQMAAMQVRPS